MARLRAIDIVQYSMSGPLSVRTKRATSNHAPRQNENPQKPPRQQPPQKSAQWSNDQDWEPIPPMERTNLLRQIALAFCSAAWVFLLLSLGSFHPTDWPTHEVYPYPPIQNLCGAVGAFVAYYSFLAIGQGVFPVLFFTGICLALLACRSRLSDPWLRGIGLAVLTVAFAAVVHHLKPGSFNGFPGVR